MTCEKFLMPFFQAHDDGYQDWEPPLSDDEEDGSYKGDTSKTSQTEARNTKEDALEIVSAIDGMVRVIIYLFML